MEELDVVLVRPEEGGLGFKLAGTAPPFAVAAVTAGEAQLG